MLMSNHSHNSLYFETSLVSQLNFLSCLIFVTHFIHQRFRVSQEWWWWWMGGGGGMSSSTNGRTKMKRLAVVHPVMLTAGRYKRKGGETRPWLLCDV